MNDERRVQTLLKATPNSWVVLSDDAGSIVIEEKTFEAAALAAEKKGLKDSVLILVPPVWSYRLL